MLVEYEELYNAYLDCRKHKRASANCQQFEIDCTRNLYVLWRELNNGKYEVGRSIAFIVHHPKDREVFAADFRDRIVHHLVIRRIEKLLEAEFIEDSYSCRKKKGTLYGINRCYDYMRKVSDNFTKEAYIFKGDMRSFFMTIDIRILYDIICRLIEDKGGYDESTLAFMKHIIYQIVFNRPQNNCILKQPKSEWDCLPRGKSLFYCDPYHGLPIGNLTSQIFANLFMSAFDHFVREDLGFWAYGRYVDDFYIISESKQRIFDALPQIRLFLSTYGITLHPNKCYIQPIYKGVEFLGQYIKPYGKFAKRRTIGTMYNKLRLIDTFLLWHEENGVQPSKSDIEYTVSSVNSYFGYLRQTKNLHDRKRAAQSVLCTRICKYAHFASDYAKLIINKEIKSAAPNIYKPKRIKTKSK